MKIDSQKFQDFTTYIINKDEQRALSILKNLGIYPLTHEYYTADYNDGLPDALHNYFGHYYSTDKQPELSVLLDFLVPYLSVQQYLSVCNFIMLFHHQAVPSSLYLIPFEPNNIPLGTLGYLIETLVYLEQFSDISLLVAHYQTPLSAFKYDNFYIHYKDESSVGMRLAHIIPHKEPTPITLITIAILNRNKMGVDFLLSQDLSLDGDIPEIIKGLRFFITDQRPMSIEESGLLGQIQKKALILYETAILHMKSSTSLPLKKEPKRL